MGKLHYSVFLLLEVSSLFHKNAISVERSLTLKKEDFALRKTKHVLNEKKLVNGHFTPVCQSSPLERMADDNLSTKELCDHPEECSSSALPPLFSIIASAPDSLKHSIIPCMLRGYPVNSLLDTGASEKFISDGIVNTVGLIPNGKFPSQHGLN